jgi:hypothetical protein
MAKITSIQQPTGNQYLKKIVYFSTRDKYRNFDGRQPESPGEKMLAANLLPPEREALLVFLEKPATGTF